MPRRRSGSGAGGGEGGLSAAGAGACAPSVREVGNALLRVGTIAPRFRRSLDEASIRTLTLRNRTHSSSMSHEPKRPDSKSPSQPAKTALYEPEARIGTAAGAEVDAGADRPGHLRRRPGP